MNLKSPLFLLLSIWLACGLSSCRQPGSATPDTDRSDPVQVEKLIAKGETFESGNTDSLPVVVKKLQLIADGNGNKTAALYADIFQTHYLWMRSDHKAAMALAVDCLSYAEKWKIDRAIPEIYGTMANLYKENADYKMAFANAEKGMSAARANKDTAEIISLLGLKAMFTHSVWLNGHNAAAPDKSLDYQLAALKMAEADPKYERMRIRFYDNISQNYKDDKDYDKAIEYGNKSVPLARKYDQPRSLTYAYCWLGQAWFFKGDHAKGLAYLDSALRISYQIKQPYRVMEIYGHLYDLALSVGDYKKAVEYGERSGHLRDSLQVDKNVKQINELQIKYETEKKDREIALLDKKATARTHEIFWIIAGSLVFITFCVLLVLQSRVIHRHNQVIKANNNQLNSALNNIAYIQSHELRKPVASILGLINVIKSDDYKTDKDTIQKLEQATKDLDKKIKAINKHTQV